MFTFFILYDIFIIGDNMKEKIRTFIVYFSLSFGIIIIFLIVYNIRNLTQEFYFKVPNTFDERLDIYRVETSTIESIECKKTIYDLIDYVDNNKYEGVMSLKEYNNRILYNPSLIQNFSNIYNKCDITKEERDNNYFDTLAISVINEQYNVLDKYMFQYEIGFQDKVRDIYGSNKIGVNMNAAYGNELLLISKFIDVIKEKEVLNNEKK